MRKIQMEFQRQNSMECASQERNGSKDSRSSIIHETGRKRVTRHNENVRTAVTKIKDRIQFTWNIQLFIFFIKTH